MKLSSIIFATGCLAALPLANAEPGFPDGSVAGSASDIQQRFSGKTFNVKLADGGTWHVEYKADGGFSLKMNNGFSDSGEWKAEDGKICSKGRRIGSSCNEVRTTADAIFLKRDSGEIVEFVPQQ